jgi:hypothetical protein
LLEIWDRALTAADTALAATTLMKVFAPGGASTGPTPSSGRAPLANDSGGFVKERWRMMVRKRKRFTNHEAQHVGEQIGIDWNNAPFDVEQFRKGMDVELEHGLDNAITNVTDDDPVVTGKIALAHLNEFSDYYTRLARMETEAEQAATGAE